MFVGKAVLGGPAPLAGSRPVSVMSLDTVRDLVSTKEASEISGRSVATINRWVREGRLTPVAEGDGPRGARFFNRADIEAMTA